MLDVGRALPYASLLSFVNYLPADSAIRRAQEPGIEWSDGRMVAPVLADLYDAITHLQYMYAMAHKGKGAKPRKPKPYPRPWVKDKTTEHFGKGAIPVSEFEKWWKGAKRGK